MDSQSMTQMRIFAQSIKSGLQLPWWLTREMPPVNADFEQRVVSLPQHARWRNTQLAGVELRVLEYIPGDRPRLSAQLRMDPAFSPTTLGENPDLEIMMQRGELESEMGIYPAGLYLRLPVSDDSHLQQLTFRCSTTPNDQGDGSSQGLQQALLYLAAGQMLTSDTEQRRINTHDESRWLPGPVEGTHVLPLHGHGTSNVMLIRWDASIGFKPRLDPMGEEVLVLNGQLHDGQGDYPAGSWIRNPISAWQSWSAQAGTLVYYKNGHFASPIDVL